MFPTTPLSLQMAQSSCDKEGWIAVLNALEMKQGKLHAEFLVDPVKVKCKLKSPGGSSTILIVQESAMLAAMASKRKVGGMVDKKIPLKLPLPARVVPAANVSRVRPHQPLDDSDTRLGCEPCDSKNLGTQNRDDSRTR